MTTAAPDEPKPPPPPPSVFLSYASEDRTAAQALRDALETYGLEVWYDESGLDGGDAWDQKIRRQIRECDFFMPVISAQTDMRLEGYFRREWRLAVERTLDMADDHPFLLPVVIDDTPQARARVPERFLGVQWTRVPGGLPVPALEGLCRRLLAGQAPAPPAATRRASEPAARAPRERPRREYPEFPREEPGQRLRFFAHVLGWALTASWVFFRRLPRWIRIVIWIWLAFVIVTRACTPLSRHDRDETPAPKTAPVTPAAPAIGEVSAADARKLRDIADSYQGSTNAGDITRLSIEMAKAFSSEVGKDLAAAENPLVAIPFAAPAGDTSAKKLADAAFAQVYGRIALTHHGHVGLMQEPVTPLEAATAAKAAHAHDAKYVLFGSVNPAAATAQSLTVKLVSVADGKLVWSGSFAVAGADPAAIAAQVDARVPALEDD
jgi:TolB-like protein